jgi:hypothetical protein
MKIQSPIKCLVISLFWLGGSWFSNQVYANGYLTCDLDSNPLVISTNCRDLVISSGTTKSAITIEPSVSIYGDWGILTQTSSSIGILTNGVGSLIDGTIFSGIDNQGTISTLNNSGLIRGIGNGISNFYDVIGNLNNLEGGVISGQDQGITNFEGGTISALTNDGTISGNLSGIFNDLGTVINLSNRGVISDGQHGIHNNGTISILDNSGTIHGSLSGVYINFGKSIGAINNLSSGLISGLGSGISSFAGNINSIVNSGEIRGNTIAIDNQDGGRIGTLINTNTGYIHGGIGISNGTIAEISNLSNAGTIIGSVGSGINNISRIIGLTNAGDGVIEGGSAGINNYEGALIDVLNNSGRISGGVNGSGINNSSSTITTINNSGTIYGGTYGVRNDLGIIDFLGNSNSGNIIANSSVENEVAYGVHNTGTIANLNNQGNITVLSTGFGGLAVGVRTTFGGAITSLLNSGVILANTTNTDGTAYGIHDSGEISTITNTGSITATSSGVNGIAYGISSIGVIGALYNAQGGNGSSPSTTALTYTGNLPTNYNVIINSASHYGQLAVTNPGSTPITNFGIYGTPLITSRTYSSVLSGTALPTGISSGTYDNMTWSLTANGAAFDLVFAGVSLMGTQQSLVNTAAALQNTYALQNSVLANSFSYDCPVFGEHNVCVSAGGRNTAVSAANGLNNTSALLIAAYRIKPTLRIGAYADQNLSVNNAGSTVNLGNSTPLIGLFGVWNQRIDGTGTEVKVAAAYGQKDTTITRQIVGTSEAGSGGSQLISQGAQVVAKYGFAVAPEVLVSPYVGMRYTQNNMGGYTEGASSTVTAPLTYSALNTNATTALAGVGASYRFIPKATLFASAGVETDTNTSNGTYSATGITGLTPVNFNPSPVKTRPTATLGAYYDIVKNQRIGITGIYRQESYQAISTTTVMATYTIGL